MRKLLIIISPILAIVLFGIYWASTHAYINFDAKDMPNGTEYSLTEQTSQRVVYGKINNASGRKLVKKGSYELYIEINGKSSLNIVKTGGFLGSTKITPVLGMENSRSFIGNNPGNCMYPVGERLVSIACGDPYNKLQAHTPATQLQPTATQKPVSVVDGFIESSAATSQGTIILVKHAVNDQVKGGHFAYVLSADGNVSNETLLTNLDEANRYSLIAYNQGFVAYSPAASRIYFYSSLDASPSLLAIPKPTTKSVQFVSLLVRNDQLAYVYTDSPRVTQPSFDDPQGIKEHSEEFDKQTNEVKNPTTEIVTKLGSTNQDYNFEVPYYGVSFCGRHNVCSLNNGLLKVFTENGNKVDLSYELSGVTAMKTTQDKFLVIKSSSVVQLDTPNARGFNSYTFGDYQFCGIESSYEGYVLCVIDNHGKRSALQVDTSKPNTDSIDKKIIKLSESTEVADVSVYGHFIHVLANVGSANINEETGDYEYSDSLIADMNAKISQKIDELSIDRSVYTIVNTLK